MEIVKPYLIQRCFLSSFKKEDYKGSRFGDFVAKDYMGAAEFEFGALPKSLKRMVKRDYTFVKETFLLRNVEVHLFLYAPVELINHENWKDYLLYWQAIIVAESNRDYYLKEPNNFGYWKSLRQVRTEEEFSKATEFLMDWDIQNDILVFSNKKFKNVIEHTLQHTKAFFEGEKEHG